MQYSKKCLHCGSLSEAENYNCSCGPAVRAPEYRCIGLEWPLNTQDRAAARKALEQHPFQQSKGMLQYPLLPNREYAPDGLPEAGLTPLYHLDELSARYEREVYIKDEGDNPSGCFKDRETLACVLNSCKAGLQRAVIYSSGNAAASAALFAKALGFRLITFVAGDTYEEKIQFIQAQGSDVIVVGDKQTCFEAGFRLYAHLNAAGVFARQGFDNWAVGNPYRVEGDKATALEIVKQFVAAQNGQQVPDYVIVPSANGSHLTGLWRGFKELQLLGFIDRLPKMVVAGIRHASPIGKAVRSGEIDRPVRCDLKQLPEEDAQIGSTIVAEESYDCVSAAKAVLASGGRSVEVGRAGIRQAMTDFLATEQQRALGYGILPEPASCIALAAVRQLRDRGIMPLGAKAVALITGHGAKAQHSINRLLRGKEILLKRANHIIERKQREQKAQRPVQRGQRVQVRAGYKPVLYAFHQLAAKHKNLSTV